MTSTIVVVGGDAAGMSAASKVKREMPDTHVIVFERDGDISYAACGIPYWLAGLVAEEEGLIALTLEQARRQRGIDVRIHHQVESVDPDAKRVTVTDLDTGNSMTQSYDKLVLATGAVAMVPPLPGVTLPGVLTLRSLQDGRRIQEYVAANSPRRAVIIGAGYIGLEMAETFHALSLDTRVVEMLDQIMPNMDGEMVEEVAAHLVDQGIQVHTSTQVSAIVQDGDHLVVRTGGAVGAIPADMVLLSTGVRPHSDLAREAGLRLSSSGAIWVDGHMRTSDPHIYAAGDCVAHHHLVLGRPAWIPLATSANKGGRIVGENLAGQESVFPGILGTAVVKVFDYSLVVTGLTEREAGEHADLFAGGVAASTITAGSRPEYYPGHEPVSIKLVLERSTGRLLGAQLVSRSDVSKRADVLAVAISAGMTVSQIGLLDLTYAPPYAPVYDPVLVAANVAVRKVA